MASVHLSVRVLTGLPKPEVAKSGMHQSYQMSRSPMFRGPHLDGHLSAQLLQISNHRADLHFSALSNTPEGKGGVGRGEEGGCDGGCDEQ